MKMYIFIRVRVQRKMHTFSNNTLFNYTFSNYTFSNGKTLFALLVTHKEKRPSSMPVNLKETKFAVFKPEVPPAPSTRKWPVREAKFNLKNYTGWNANSYIFNMVYTNNYNP